MANRGIYGLDVHFHPVLHTDEEPQTECLKLRQRLPQLNELHNILPRIHGGQTWSFKFSLAMGKGSNEV